MYLGNNPLTCTSIGNIADAIKLTDTLEILNLSNCQIGDEGMRLLIDSLAQNSTIHTLDITGNFASTSLVSKAQAESMSIQYLLRLQADPMYMDCNNDISTDVSQI